MIFQTAQTIPAHAARNNRQNVPQTSTRRGSTSLPIEPGFGG